MTNQALAGRPPPHDLYAFDLSKRSLEQVALSFARWKAQRMRSEASPARADPLPSPKSKYQVESTGEATPGRLRRLPGAHWPSGRVCSNTACHSPICWRPAASRPFSAPPGLLSPRCERRNGLLHRGVGSGGCRSWPAPPWSARWQAAHCWSLLAEATRLNRRRRLRMLDLGRFWGRSLRRRQASPPLNGSCSPRSTGR